MLLTVIDFYCTLDEYFLNLTSNDPRSLLDDVIKPLCSISFQAVDRVTRASKALVVSRNRATKLSQPMQNDAMVKASAGKDSGEEERVPFDFNGGKGWEGGKVETLITTKKGSVAVGRITPQKGNPGRRLSVSADIGDGLEPHELEQEQHLDNDEIAAGGGPHYGRRRMDAKGAPGGGGPSSTTIVLSNKVHSNKVQQSPVDSASRGWRVDPSNPTPPPMCPSRLLDLFEEALIMAAGGSLNGSMESDWFWSWSNDGEEGAIDGWFGGRQGPIIPTWLEWAFPSRGRMSVEEDLVLRSLRSGFQAIAAYRAHDTAKGIEGSDGEDGGGRSKRRGRTFPLHVVGFTWDGVTVVAKETVPGCARVAQPTVGPEGDWSSFYDDDDPSFFWDEFGDVGDVDELSAASSSNMVEGEGEEYVEKREDAARGGKRSCMRVEQAMVPTVATVVDIIVPVQDFLVVVAD